MEQNEPFLRGDAYILFWPALAFSPTEVTEATREYGFSFSYLWGWSGLLSFYNHNLGITLTKILSQFWKQRYLGFVYKLQCLPDKAQTLIVA